MATVEKKPAQNEKQQQNGEVDTAAEASEQLGIDAPDSTVLARALAGPEGHPGLGRTGSPSGVVRPAAHEWDEREEFPWPVVQEAAKIGLYGFEAHRAVLGRPHRAHLPIVNEELFWGDAGIGMAIIGHDARGRRHLRLGHARADGRVGAAVLRHRGRRQGRRLLRLRARRRLRRLGAPHHRQVRRGEGRVGPQRPEGLGHQRRHRQRPRRDRLRRPRARLARPRRLRHPARHQGPRAGREGQEARHPRLAHRRRPPRRLPRPRRCLLGGKEKLDERLASAREGKSSKGQAAMQTFELSRPTVGAQAIGIARAAYEYALDYAKEREAVRPQDHREPGDRLHARRHEDGDRRRAPAGLARRLDGQDRQGLRRTPRARCRS